MCVQQGPNNIYNRKNSLESVQTQAKSTYMLAGQNKQENKTIADLRSFCDGSSVTSDLGTCETETSVKKNEMKQSTSERR